MKKENTCEFCKYWLISTKLPNYRYCDNPKLYGSDDDAKQADDLMLIQVQDKVLTGKNFSCIHYE